MHCAAVIRLCTSEGKSTTAVNLLCAQVRHSAVTFTSTATLSGICHLQPLSMSWGSVADYMEAEVCFAGLPALHHYK
jgi:hypothetical protein